MADNNSGLTGLDLFIIMVLGLRICLYLHDCVVELQGIRDALQ